MSTERAASADRHTARRSVFRRRLRAVIASGALLSITYPGSSVMTTLSDGITIVK